MGARASWAERRSVIENMRPWGPKLVDGRGRLVIGVGGVGLGFGGKGGRRGLMDE